jgi:alkylated DNA repair dioxygenase AlkB
MQVALFGSGAPAFDARLPSIRRQALSAGAWIEHHPGWLEGHQRVFEQLRLGAAWQSHRRQMYEREVDVPRLVARAPSEGPIAELLARLSATLTERYRRVLSRAADCRGGGPRAGGRALDNISLAYYRDGNDSVAFHGDKVGRLANDTIVATVSVGAPRRFLLKPNPKTNPVTNAERSASASLAFDLGWGDLFVMGGTCQRTWLHAVPKRAHADPRISIMFRPAMPEA